MELYELTAISPLDGRYASKTEPLRAYFSEYALIYYRLTVEIEWLRFLANDERFTGLQWDSEPPVLQQIKENWSLNEARYIKQLESRTNHDVKAVEYYLYEQLEADQNHKALQPFIHFGCTSEDINNLAYSLMFKHANEAVLHKQIDRIIQTLASLSQKYAPIAMLARTHGQPASPTTLGKELANFTARLKRQRRNMHLIDYQGKFSGATGNFNAHIAAYPDLDWQTLANDFVSSLGLSYNAYTTQIEPHDFISELCHNYHQLNSVLLDFVRDIWSYIAMGYFKQNTAEEEVGSSTMPHKVNPIDFENAEGNLGLANALLDHFANKLPVSRLQRDLSDSTVMRNVGSAFSYCSLAYLSILQGLDKIKPDQSQIDADLSANWSILAEAVQTVMRRYGDSQSYDTLKRLTRGQSLDREQYQNLIENLSLPDDAKERLQSLQPHDYTGIAKALAEAAAKNT